MHHLIKDRPRFLKIYDDMYSRLTIRGTNLIISFKYFFFLLQKVQIHYKFLIKNSMHLLKLRDYKCSNNFEEEEEEEKKLIINAMMNTKDKHYL